MVVVVEMTGQETTQDPLSIRYIGSEIVCQLRGRKSGRGLLIGIRNVALIYWCTVIIVYCLFVLLLIYGGAFSVLQRRC